jgi:hypothetical protein
MLFGIVQFWKHGWFNYKFWKSKGPPQTLMWTRFITRPTRNQISTSSNNCRYWWLAQTCCVSNNLLQMLMLDDLCTHNIQHTLCTQMHMNINPLQNCKILPTNDNLHTLHTKQWLSNLRRLSICYRHQQLVHTQWTKQRTSKSLAHYKAHAIKQLGKKQALEGSNLELQVPTNWRSPTKAYINKQQNDKMNKGKSSNKFIKKRFNHEMNNQFRDKKLIRPLKVLRTWTLNNDNEATFHCQLANKNWISSMIFHFQVSWPNQQNNTQLHIKNQASSSMCQHPHCHESIFCNL